MENKKIQVALFGLGNMGRNHLRVLLENKEFELKALIDPFITEVHPLAKEIPLFKSIDEALEKSSFDAAVVATPTETHFEVTKKLLKNSKKLLVEKPIASNPEQCAELIELAQKKNLVLNVAHVERSNPAVRKAKEVIDKGWIGKPIHYSFTRVGGYPQNIKKGNNVLLDLAVHDIDVLHFLEGKFELKACVAHNTVHDNIADTAEILLASKNSVSANIHVNWITPTKIRSLRITGTKGVVFVDYMLQTCELHGGNLIAQNHKKDFNYQELQSHYKNTDKIEFGVHKEEPLKIQLREWLHSLRSEESKLASALEASRAVQLAEDALK